MNFSKSFFKAILIILIIGLSIFSILNNYNKNIDANVLEKKIEQIRIDNSIPSIQASIISNNKLKWVGQFGEGEENSSYMIGSVQKIFTSVAILQLFETGFIKSLDDDISNYMPFKIINPNNKEIPITFKMLLSHRSGMVDELPYQFLWDTEALAYPKYRTTYNGDVLSMTTEEYLYACLHENGSLYSLKNWIAPPNDRFWYSASGFVLLTYLIEKISNMTVANYMKNSIFIPLNMKNTGFEAKNQVLPFAMINGEITELPLWTGKYMIRSTSFDMAKFMLALMNDGGFGGERILQKKSVTLMKSSNPDWSKRQSIFIFDSENFDLNTNGYGLAWDRYSAGINGHGGSVPGFQAYFLCKEDFISKNGIILLMNVNTILGTKYDREYLFSQFVKIRNLLLSETGMISPLRLTISLITSFGTAVILIIPLILINFIFWKEKEIKKSKRKLLYKISYLLSFTIYLEVGLITINKKNLNVEFLGLCTLMMGILLLMLSLITLKKQGETEILKNNMITKMMTKKGLHKYLQYAQYAGLLLLSVASILLIQNMELIGFSLLSLLFVIPILYEDKKGLSHRLENPSNVEKNVND